MELIPSIDLLNGHAVRLQRGDFGAVTTYGEADEVLEALDVPPGSRLHVVDLEASRRGAPVELRPRSGAGGDATSQSSLRVKALPATSKSYR